MATYTVITYQCPRCRLDLGRRLGLITSKSILCPGCGTRVRIGTNVICQNWAYNFGWVGGLLTWFGLAALVLLDPQFAAKAGGRTFPSSGSDNRLMLAGLSALPAILAGLGFALVGAV